MQGIINIFSFDPYIDFLLNIAAHPLKIITDQHRCNCGDWWAYEEYKPLGIRSFIYFLSIIVLFYRIC